MQAGMQDQCNWKTWWAYVFVNVVGMCAGLWAHSNFSRESTQFWQCNITLLLWSTILRLKFNIFFVYAFGGYPELGGEFRSFFKVSFAVTRKHRLRHPTSKPSSFFGSFIQCSHCGMQACHNNVGPMQLECWPCAVRMQGPCNQNASTQLGCRLQCAQLQCRPSATRMFCPVQL